MALPFYDVTFDNGLNIAALIGAMIVSNKALASPASPLQRGVRTRSKAEAKREEN